MEQRKLIKLKGEIREMTCSEVYEQFKKFIYKTANSFSNSCESLDDLVQIGSIGLIKAFNSYKIESNYNFITLLAIVVNNEFRMKLRKEKRRKSVLNEVSFDDCLCTDVDGKSLILSDVIKEPTDCEEIVMKRISDIELRKFISELRPLNKNILEMYFFSNMKQCQIVKELNFSQSYISRLLKQSLKILKRKYERNESLMTKKEECYKFLSENDSKPRKNLIDQAVAKFGVTEKTARTYYSTWRKEFMAKPGYVDPPKNGMQEKVINVTEIPHHITGLAKNNTKVAERTPIKVIDIPVVAAVNKPIIPDIDIVKIVSNAFAEVKQTFHGNNEKIFAEANERAAIKNEKLISEVKKIINPKVEGINWKVDAINPVKTEKEKEDILVVSRLVPVIMKGKYGEYQFAKEGVKNTPNEDFISKDKMDEALEALEIWERCYGNGSTQVC